MLNYFSQLALSAGAGSGGESRPPQLVPQLPAFGARNEAGIPLSSELVEMHVQVEAGVPVVVQERVFGTSATRVPAATPEARQHTWYESQSSDGKPAAPEFREDLVSSFAQGAHRSALPLPVPLSAQAGPRSSVVPLPLNSMALSGTVRPALPGPASVAPESPDSTDQRLKPMDKATPSLSGRNPTLREPNGATPVPSDPLQAMLLKNRIGELKSQPTQPLPKIAPTAPPPAPTIHISIGRIEVRAPGTVPKERPRTAPIQSGPKLTLDHYLNQRNEAKK